MKLTPRDKRLRKTYGITETQYNQLLSRFYGCCWLCLKPPKAGTVLHVDHEHVKGGGGRIRGLLHMYCNRRVIGRHKDPELFDKAAAYLRLDTGLRTPRNRKKTQRRRAKR